MIADFDIAICGAGPVGLALAALLVKRGVAPGRIALIDAKPLSQVESDPRSIALSWGSRQLLDEIGAWPIDATPIHQIHVSRRGHLGRTVIDRDEYDLPALGYVARYGALVSTLARTVAPLGATIIRPAQVTALTESDEAVTLAFSDRTALSSSIVVQAEGGVFSDQTAKSLRRNYEQTAIVARVRCSAPIAHRAFERFTNEGPLAILPQDDGYALVWCVRPATAERLMALSDNDFLRELNGAFGSRLGRFVDASARNTYPLGLNARPATSARTVAIGNAAQTLHPVAGQGLNLGLRDAAVLARLLARQAAPTSLAGFVATRQSDRNLTIQLTDAMARVFASAPDGALSQTALGLSLGLVDVFKPARHLLAEQMMYGWR